MKNICVIGAKGKLGSELVKHPNAVECPWQFQDSMVELKNWFDNHKDIDTVWHVARACRTEGTRRDAVTFLLDTGGLVKILGTRAKSCRFVYASSKIVYGLKGVSDNLAEVLTAEEVAKYFFDDHVGTINCPDWQITSRIDISKLDNQRTIYACTKLANEQLIRRTCPNHKIIRIWDIL